jgi:hypothetical protein
MAADITLMTADCRIIEIFDFDGRSRFIALLMRASIERDECH